VNSRIIDALDGMTGGRALFVFLLAPILGCQQPPPVSPEESKGNYHELKEIAQITSDQPADDILKTRRCLQGNGILTYIQGSHACRVLVHNRDVTVAAKLLRKNKELSGIRVYDNPLPVPLPQMGYPPDLMVIASFRGTRKAQVSVLLTRIMRENEIRAYCEGLSAGGNAMVHDIDADKAVRVLAAHLDSLGPDVFPINPPHYVEGER